MLSRFFGDNIHRYLHVLGLSGVAFGIPLNKVVMSSSMVFIALNLLTEAKFKEGLKNLKSNKLYWLVAALFLLHVVGLLWSENMAYGLHDLRVTVPLFVIPTMLVARPIKKRSDLHLVLGAFLTSVLIVSFINFGMYQHWFGNHQYDDIRGMSLFSSHVRFGIIVSMGVAILLYFLKYFKWMRLLIFLLTLWLSYYTFYSQVLSGASTLAGVFLVFALYLLWGKRKGLALTFLSLFTIAGLSLLIWLITPIKVDPKIFENLPTQTAEGNPYVHYNRLVSPETGKPIYLYVCEEEVERDWPERSEIPYDGLDKKGQCVRFTLLRYLASKELTKDAEGLSKLSDKEIADIENGIGSSKNYGLMGRLYGLKYQLINEQDPNGNSLMERIEYWKAGFSIFSKNMLIGVGTGDVQDEFDTYYIESNSPLDEENRHRAHNMFLSIALTFGIPGIFIFLLFHIKMITFNIGNKEILAVLFVTIALISFLMEDTWETQTGITFCAFFYGIFSSIIPLDDKASDTLV